MEHLFSYNSSESEDFYKILGCSQHSNADQIITEFKKRVISAHPDKNPGDSTAHERFELLKQAKDTLSDPELRKIYDKWINSGKIMPWNEWLNRSKSHQMMFHWNIKKPDAMIMDKANEGVDSTESDKFKISKFNDDSDDILRKFRNYQI